MRTIRVPSTNAATVWSLFLRHKLRDLPRCQSPPRPTRQNSRLALHSKPHRHCISSLESSTLVRPPEVVSTHTAVSSAARCSRARDNASRRLVFTRSPGRRGMSDGATTMQSCPMQGSVDTDHNPWARPRNSSAASHSDLPAYVPAWQLHPVYCQTLRDTEPHPVDRPRRSQPRSSPWRYRSRQILPYISSWLVPCALRIGLDHPGDPRSFPHIEVDPSGWTVWRLG